jgi:hypothetical protein
VSFVAVHEDRPILATPEGPRRAACPGCLGEMWARTGDVMTHHWAHAPDPRRVCPPDPNAREKDVTDIRRFRLTPSLSLLHPTQRRPAVHATDYKSDGAKPTHPCGSCGADAAACSSVR